MKRAYNKLKSSSQRNIFKEWEPLLNNLGHVCRKLKYYIIHKTTNFIAGIIKFTLIPKIRKYTESIEFHREALALHPTNASTWTSIGLTSVFLNKFDDAIEYFHQVLY